MMPLHSAYIILIATVHLFSPYAMKLEFCLLQEFHMQWQLMDCFQNSLRKYIQNMVHPMLL